MFLLANETWDDFGFKTTFIAHVLQNRRWFPIGTVGIARKGQERGSTYELLGRPGTLASLGDDYYSLGGEVDYYRSLVDLLGHEQALGVLYALNDVAIDPGLYSEVESEPALRSSLIRSTIAVEARDKAREILELSPTDLRDRFRIRVNLDDVDGSHDFDFDFTRLDRSSSRVAVLVGLNGTGKTQSMASIARLLTQVIGSTGRGAPESSGDWVQPRPSVYGVVAVSFSAFDEFVLPTRDDSSRFRYTYCGLRARDPRSSVLREASLNADVQRRFLAVSPGYRYDALVPLVPSLDTPDDIDAWCESGDIPFERLSAGQRIVLAISSELVNNVEERTLVLMDEPEMHLHPQLVSSLMAWLKDLLEERNSFAIVATHSPSVVQQVRSSSVHVLKRREGRPLVAKPLIETFGANLTEISNEVFEDRDGDRGYQEVLSGLFEQYRSAAAVNQLFNGRLTANAMIYLHSLEAE